MSGARALPPLVGKEVRALAPVWVAAVLTMTLVWLTGANPPPPGRWGLGYVLAGPLGALTYVLAAVTLGAMSIGHEYAYRTLGLLLSQPGDRRRLLQTKTVVLALLLAGLGIVALLTFVNLTGGEARAADPTLQRWGAWSLLVLPLLSGLAIAPWLTMVFRNPIAGVVFTIAIPAALLVAGDALVFVRHGFERGPGDRYVNLAVLWAGMVAVSAVGAFLGRRMFLRLEAIGEDGELRLPGALRRLARDSAPVSRHAVRRANRPVVMLLRKELRLQSAIFLIAGLYVVAWAVVSLIGGGAYWAGSVFLGVTILYAGLIAALVGSLASAEERGFGTLEWQMLQPYPAWKQWTVKVATALALVVAVALALPLLLDAILPFTSDEPVSALRARSGAIGWRVGSAATQGAALAVVASCGLYISSLCAGGLRALLLTFPFVAGAFSLWMGVVSGVNRIAWDALQITAFTAAAQRAFDAGRRYTIWTSDAIWWTDQSATWLAVAAVAGFAILMLRFAFVNHRSAERGRRRTVGQLGRLALYVLLAAAIAGGIRPFLLWALASRDVIERELTGPASRHQASCSPTVGLASYIVPVCLERAS